MANGGIPVSGGTSGSGTLIGTNLLRSPLIQLSGVYITPAYTLGGTAGGTGHEVDWIKDGDEKTKLLTAASASEMTVTMISSKSGAPYPTVYGVVLIGHNLTAANITTAKFEGGTTTGYSDVSEDLVINAATLSPAYHLLTTPQAYKYWRLRIQFTSELALQIGEAFLIGQAPCPFAKNFNWGSRIHEELGRITSEGAAGIKRATTRWLRRWQEINFDRISQAQFDNLAAVARNAYAIFSPSGSDGYAYHGAFEIEPGVEQFIDQYSLKATFTEAAK